MKYGFDLNIRRLQVLTVIVPLVFLLVLELVSLLVLQPLFDNNSTLRLSVIFLILIVATLPFSLWVFAVIAHQQREFNRQLEFRVRDLAVANEEITRRVRELDAANTAITSISSALDLSHVLQNIADSARDLVQSRYAALGVSDDDGRIVHFITSGITHEQRTAIGPLPQGHGLLGALITDATPIRIANIGKDPRSFGFPPNHPPMTSLLGVPIVFKGKPMGNLYLTDKLGAESFSQDDQELLIVLANHAAVAIENARLYEETSTSRDRLQAWSEELELKVAERTREIEHYSKELATRVLQAQEEERKRLARELHDDTAQSLSTLLINVDLLDPLVPAEADRLRGGLERIRELTVRTLDNVRALSHDLRPTILDDFGLVAALRWYVDEYEDTFGVHVDVEIESPPRPLTPELELALFRIAQEALANCGKYADATGAILKLTFPTGYVVLTIADNGKGFDLHGVSAPTKHGGLGLYGMQERADLLGAVLDIDTMPGRGTRVTVSVPLVSSGGTSMMSPFPVGLGTLLS